MSNPSPSALTPAEPAGASSQPPQQPPVRGRPQGTAVQRTMMDMRAGTWTLARVISWQSWQHDHPYGAAATHRVPAGMGECVLTAGCSISAARLITCHTALCACVYTHTHACVPLSTCSHRVGSPGGHVPCLPQLLQGLVGQHHKGVVLLLLVPARG